MAENSKEYELNYFFRDYVTEDIVSYCIGEVYLYNFKETLIGVRAMDKNVGFFVDINTVEKQMAGYVPTLDHLTDQHIKEAVEEVDRSNEKTSYIPIGEIVGKAQELLANEISKLLDKKIMGDG